MHFSPRNWGTWAQIIEAYSKNKSNLCQLKENELAKRLNPRFYDTAI